MYWLYSAGFAALAVLSLYKGYVACTVIGLLGIVACALMAAGARRYWRED